MHAVLGLSKTLWTLEPPETSLGSYSKGSWSSRNFIGSRGSWDSRGSEGVRNSWGYSGFGVPGTLGYFRDTRGFWEFYGTLGYRVSFGFGVYRGFRSLRDPKTP